MTRYVAFVNGCGANIHTMVDFKELERYVQTGFSDSRKELIPAHQYSFLCKMGKEYPSMEFL